MYPSIACILAPRVRNLTNASRGLDIHMDGVRSLITTSNVIYLCHTTCLMTLLPPTIRVTSLPRISRSEVTLSYLWESSVLSSAAVYNGRSTMFYWERRPTTGAWEMGMLRGTKACRFGSRDRRRQRGRQARIWVRTIVDSITRLDVGCRRDGLSPLRV